MLGKLREVLMPTPAQALPGRTTPVQLSNRHYINGNPICAPFPAGIEVAIFALGCFWGAERKFWQLNGVFSTAVGYIAGYTPNPSYEELCTGLTGHAEAVLVAFAAQQISYTDLLQVFWEAHNPTQGMRQGNDIGTQYRSGIYTVGEAQSLAALASMQHYQQRLSDAGYAAITTEILPASEFYYAEEYHQQYLAKNPLGYCGLGGCAVSYAD